MPEVAGAVLILPAGQVVLVAALMALLLLMLQMELPTQAEVEEAEVEEEVLQAITGAPAALASSS
jgi:hypothetical protein